MSSHGTPAIALTTDVVLLCMHTGQLHILLVQRKYPPFAGQWALPGGFVEAGESLTTAAQRELYEETGVRDVYVEQIGAFGDPQRDPRRHVVSIAFVGLSATLHTPQHSDETPLVAWFPLAQCPTPLAFDHDRIIAHARTHLAHACISRPLLFHLVPTSFTLDMLHHAYQIITHQSIDVDVFDATLRATGAITPSQPDGYYTATPHYHTPHFCMPWPSWRH